MRESHITRRALLGGSLVLAVGACEPLGSTEPEVAPEVTTLRRALDGEQELLTLYAGVRARHPQLADRLDPILAEHRAHVRALQRQASPPPTVRPAPSASASSRAAPERVADARSALVTRERAAAEARLGQLPGAPPFLAQLLASIAAAEASHAELLNGGR